MQLKLYFEMHNKMFTDHSKNPKLGGPKIPYITIPSNWYPPEICPEIEELCNKLKYGIKFINTNYKIKPNLSKKEFQALINLKMNNNIIIKAADKGDVTVILNTGDYETKMTEDLSNNRPTAYLKMELSNYNPK